MAAATEARVDSELSCPVLVAHQMSASSGSVLPRGSVGKADALSTFPQARRRADLSGAFGILDRSVFVVSADAPRSMEEGV